MLTIVTSRTYTADLVALLLNLRGAANCASGAEHEAPKESEAPKEGGPPDSQMNGMTAENDRSASFSGNSTLVALT